MKPRFRRAWHKLSTFYSGWRSMVVIAGVAVLLLGALIDQTPGWIIIGVVWVLTLLLIGAQEPPKTTVVTVQAEQAKPSALIRDREPLVTVVVTNFNEGEFLTHCLASVRSQTHSRIECLVVDDTSTDESVAMAMKEVEDDPRFTLIRNPANIGLAASRNVGLKAATGRMVTFLDGDDFLFPSAIGERVSAFESAHDNGMLGGSFCNWEMVPETAVPGSEPPTHPRRRNVTWLSAVEDNPFIASAPLILTDGALAVGGFDEDRVTAEDFDFWARYLRHGYALRATQYVGIAYRQKKASMYRKTILDHVDIQLDVYAFNYRALQPNEIRPGTPFVFAEAPSHYQQQLMRSRRLLVGFTVATHDRNQHAAEHLLGEFERSIESWMLWAVDWERLIRTTAVRLEAYDPEGADGRVADLTLQVQLKVQPLLLASTPHP